MVETDPSYAIADALIKLLPPTVEAEAVLGGVRAAMDDAYRVTGVDNVHPDDAHPFYKLRPFEAAERLYGDAAAMKKYGIPTE